MQLLSVLMFFYTKLDLYKLTVLRSFGGGYIQSDQNGFFQYKKSPLFLMNLAFLLSYNVKTQ
jgi:hypothetical protein